MITVYKYSMEVNPRYQSSSTLVTSRLHERGIYLPRRLSHERHDANAARGIFHHAVDQVGGMTSQQHPDTHRYLSFGSKTTNSLRGLSDPAEDRLGAAGKKLSHSLDSLANRHKNRKN